nr:hypothetical protein [Tanacetum cinerariifolium]
MSTNEKTPASQPTSAVRNTLGKEQVSQDLGRPALDAALQEFCDMTYHQLLQIIAEKVHQKKAWGQEEGYACVLERLKASVTPVATETLKAATRVLVQGKQSLLLKNIIKRASSRRMEKTMRENTRSQNPSDRSQALRTICPNRASKDPKDHLKIFHAAAKTERWAMPTWCHMFNSTLTGNAEWFDNLSKESINNYDDLKKAFLENYLQQKKCIKDPVEIHNIKQREGESTKEFLRRYKLECRDVKGASECMKIFRFMHGITNPKLIKRLHDKILRSVDEMMSVKHSFEERWRPLLVNGKSHSHHENSKKLDISRTSRREASGTNRGQSESRTGHTTNECMHLKRQIEKMLKAGKLSHLIKELKQSNRKDQVKAAKKGKTSGKEKRLAILMVQPWQRVAKQRITQTFSLDSAISFPPLGDEDGTEGLMIIEAKIGGHFVHRIEEIIWPLGQISLHVKIGDEEHSTSVWMNFMISSRIISFECTMVLGPRTPQPVINQVTKEKIQVAIHPEYPKQTIAIDSTLIKEGRKELCSLLRSNLDIFAWKPTDTTGVPRHIEEHSLNICEGCLPVRQKKRGQARERNKAIYEEVKN